MVRTGGSCSSRCGPYTLMAADTAPEPWRVELQGSDEAPENPVREEGDAAPVVDDEVGSGAGTAFSITTSMVGRAPMSQLCARVLAWLSAHCPHARAQAAAANQLQSKSSVPSGLPPLARSPALPPISAAAGGAARWAQ